MPYILYKSNGQQLTVVQDGSIDPSSTSLTFVGKNYAGYGQILDQNMAKLLENFANSASPTKPLIGQLWYDSSTKNLKVYNGARFRSIQKFDSGNSTPTDVVKGDLWFNDADQKLYLFNGSTFVMIGPQNSTFNKVALNPVQAQDNTTLVGQSQFVLEFDITDSNNQQAWPAIISKTSFTPNITDNLIKQGFAYVQQGITLPGSGPATGPGVSYDNGYLLWGTASSSLGLYDTTHKIFRSATDYVLASTYVSDRNNGFTIPVDAGINFNNILKIYTNTSNREGIISGNTGNKITFSVYNDLNSTVTTVIQINENNIIPSPDPINTWDVNLGTPFYQFGSAYFNTVTTNLITANTVTCNVLNAGTIIGNVQGNFTGNISTTGTIVANYITAMKNFTGTLNTGSVTVNGQGITTPLILAGNSDSSPGTISGQWALRGASTLNATYADLAERYYADAVYESGTVLVIGGINEVTTTEIIGDPTVAGVVSTNPAYTMNAEAGNNDTHPYIALKGRVPCKVFGKIAKGDLLVTSEHAGYAQAYSCDDHPSAVIGKALEDHSEGFGVIEIKV